MIEWIALAGAAYGIYNWLTGDSDSEKGSGSSSSRGGSGGSNYSGGSGSSFNFGGYNFRFAGAIEINPYEEYSYADYEVGGPRNEYGNKRYCTFSLPGLPSSSGVYLWVRCGVVEYIGKTNNFRERFSHTGYGHISPYNCRKGGQTTNCKMNSAVMDNYPDEFWIYIYETRDYSRVETELLRKYPNTHYNKQIP